MSVFLFIASCLAVSEDCTVPLSIVGALNAIMAAVIAWHMPYRRPLENVLMILQFACSSVLAFGRSQKAEWATAMFYVIALSALLSLVYQCAVQLLEVLWTYDDELEQYYDPSTSNTGAVMFSRGNEGNF